METLTIVLSALLSLSSSSGLILEQLVQGRIPSAVSVEQQAVRIDNRPSYQVIQGKLDRVRVASRGITLETGLKIAAVDLELDPVDLELAQANFQDLDRIRESLEKPISGVARLVLTEADLNLGLQSPEILEQIQNTLNQAIASRASSGNLSYQITNLNLEFLGANRLQLEFKLNRSLDPAASALNPEPPESSTADNSRNGDRELEVVLATTFQVVNGSSIRLSDPTGTINQRPLSSRLLRGFAEGISDRLDLTSFTDDGIIARILQLEIDEDKLELISFIRLDTKAQKSSM
ncbi:MAG: DUF2993 domain-containing protein [Cyanobacteria bacterium J06621_8]